MKPVDAYCHVVDELTKIIKQPYRETDLTADEWDKWTNAILLLAKREKEQAHEQH